MGTSVALSGGGHRASLFGLGALLYLADAGENGKVSSIASVSGGSITNGYLAKSTNYRAESGAGVRDAMQPMAQVLAREGTFMGAVKPKVLPLVVGNLGAAIVAFARWPVRGDYAVLRLLVFLAAGGAISYFSLGRSLRTPAGQVYGTVLLPTALAALILPFLLPGSSGLGWTLLRLVGAVVLLLVWVEAVLRLRGPLCLHAYRRSLFPESGGKAPLASVARPGLAQVFCATELQTGDQMYFSPRFVYSYQLGSGTPGALDVASAVQASAALPGAFPPQRQRTAQFDMAYALTDKPVAADRATPFPSEVVLVDGGVYDNMGDEWGGGYESRVEIWPGLANVCDPPERLIVVNASGGKGFKALAKPWLPGMAEVQAVSSDKDVLYDQTTAQRRKSLVARFRLADAQDKGLRGVLVHISQSPYRVPLASRDSVEGKVALDKLAELGVSDAEWARIARANQSVATTLAPLGDEASARLVWHAYVLAAVNLHVILGVPLPDKLPTLATVQGWVAGGAWTTA